MKKPVEEEVGKDDIFNIPVIAGSISRPGAPAPAAAAVPEEKDDDTDHGGKRRSSKRNKRRGKHRHHQSGNGSQD